MDVARGVRPAHPTQAREQRTHQERGLDAFAEIDEEGAERGHERPLAAHPRQPVVERGPAGLRRAGITRLQRHPQVAERGFHLQRAARIAAAQPRLERLEALQVRVEDEAVGLRRAIVAAPPPPRP